MVGEATGTGYLDRLKPCGNCCDRCDHVNLGCDDCCKCVPRSLCLTTTVWDGSGTGTGTACSDQDAVTNLEFNCVTELWEGTYGGSAVTAYITTTGTGGCSLILEGTCFNNGAQLVADMNAPVGAPNDPDGPGCKTLSHTWYEVAIHADCTASGCGYADVSLTPRDILTLPFKDGGCNYFCGSCQCICDRVCIDVSLSTPASVILLRGSGTVTVESCSSQAIKWYDLALALTDELGTTVNRTFRLYMKEGTGTGSLGTSDNGDCIVYMEVIDATGLIGETDTAEVVCGSGTDAMNAVLTFTDGSDIYSISTSCSLCTECTTLVNSPCCDNDIPSTLNVTIVEDNDCPCFSGVTGQIVYNPITGRWVGDLSAPTCNTGSGESTIIHLELECTTTGPSSSWLLYHYQLCEFSTGTALNSLTLTTTECDPVYLVSDTTTDDACCDSVFAASSFHFVISEP